MHISSPDASGGTGFLCRKYPGQNRPGAGLHRPFGAKLEKTTKIYQLRR